MQFVEKYLSKFASNKWLLKTNYSEKISNAVVIPAISEFENIKKLITSLEENDEAYFESTLIIFVINSIKSSSKEIKEKNQKSLEYLSTIKSKLKIGIVDASSEGNELHEKDGGVGFARKIGMDLALQIFDYKSSSKKILICLDADCTVSKNYLKEIINQFNENNLSVVEIYFEHSLTEDLTINKAIICYEIFIRYYVLGLTYAYSPYAFHTIGSSMACDIESYTKVGGMNKRKAGEDFYFLEKLSKNFKINKIKNAIVHPSSRPSWRVPFGTGQRVNRYLSNTQNEYLLYSPESFKVLKKWLRVLSMNKTSDAMQYLNRAKEINRALHNFLIEQNFGDDWENIIRSSKTNEQIELQKKLWFDGFRTLKLIHYLRDNEFPLENMFVALDETLKLMKIEKDFERRDIIADYDTQIKYLELLRKVQRAKE